MSSFVEHKSQTYDKTDQIIEPVIDPNDLIIKNLKLKPLMEGLNIDKEKMFELSVKNQMTWVRGQSPDGQIIHQYYDKTIKDDYYYYGNYRPIIDNIWSISRYTKEVEYRSLGYHEKESTLLWHGTKFDNVASILDTGLIQPNPIIRVGLFGPAIYFADRAIKSMMYTRTRPSALAMAMPPNPNMMGHIYGPTGYFFLCQVTTSKKYEICRRQSFRETPKGYDCVKALGTYQSDSNDVTLLDNMIIPWGEATKHQAYTELRYNEYMVFDPKRILIKYLVQFTWHN